MIASPSAVIAAAELLDELAELGQTGEACALCKRARGESHAQDCLAERAGVILRALDGDDEKARERVDARTKDRRYRPGTTAGKLADRRAAAAAREAVRS